MLIRRRIKYRYDFDRAAGKYAVLSFLSPEKQLAAQTGRAGKAFGTFACTKEMKETCGKDKNIC